MCFFLLTYVGFEGSEDVDPSHRSNTDLSTRPLFIYPRERGGQKIKFPKENMKCFWKFYRGGWGMQHKKPSVGLVHLDSFRNNLFQNF